MNTSTRRSSTRLRERQQASSSATNAAQSVRRSSHAQPPTVSINKPASAKRRKILHGPEQPSGPRPTVTARADGRVKGRRGHLKLVTEMPMDVLYEVFSALEPVDFLHLSWANKTLHYIVMSKSARYLWEDAFKAVYASDNAPPPCPSDLNLAQYARLLFDKRCMMCNSPHGSHVAWCYRLRVCASCLETDRFTVLTSSMSYRFWAIIPMIRTFVHGKYQTYALSSDYNEVKCQTETLVLDSEEWREYTKKRGEWVINRRKDEWNFMQWQRDQKRGRKNELESIRIKRRNAIVEKLNELGWKEELSYLNTTQLWTLPGMRIAKPLTNKVWETLCPEIIEHLEAVKDLRMEQEKQKRIERRSQHLSRKLLSWAKQQPEPALMPKFLDLVLTEPFKSFVMTDSQAEPMFMTDENEFAKAMECFTEQWNASRDQFLISLLPTSLIKPSAKGKAKADATTSANPLELATVFFQCPTCVEPIGYPRILAHGCQRQFNTTSNRREADPEELAVFSATLFERPWICDSRDLIFDHEASEVAQTIVRECGGNPDAVTASWMDEKNWRLECVQCLEPKKGKLVMKWKMAIRHELEKHAESDNSTPLRKGKKKKQPEQKWRLVSNPEELTIIYTKEEENSCSSNLRRPQLECKICRVLVVGESWAMQSHWTHHHLHDDGQNQYQIGHDPEPSSSLEPPQMIDDALLRTKFKLLLDTPIKACGLAVRIPLRQKKEEEDVKLE